MSAEFKRSRVCAQGPGRWSYPKHLLDSSVLQLMYEGDNCEASGQCAGSLMYMNGGCCAA